MMTSLVVVWCALALAPALLGAPPHCTHCGGREGSSTATHTEDAVDTTTRAEDEHAHTTLVETTDKPQVSTREVWAPGSGRGLLGTRDPLLAALAGARGALRAVVCAHGLRVPAVLWRARWVLTRATDVHALPLEHAHVLLTHNHLRTCYAYEREPLLMSGRARRVVSVLEHPLWQAARAQYDAALLELDAPLHAEDTLANDTIAVEQLEPLQYWMEIVYESFRNHENEYIQKRRVHSEYAMIVSVVVPAVTFLAFFLFVTFNTGTPIKVPYTNVKGGIKTPWMNDHDSEIKCYPACGKV